MAFPDSRHSEGLFSFGDFQVDPRSGELTKHGIRIKLQEKPFQILVYLLVHAGELVTREDLRASVWGSDTYLDFDHSLNIAINKLREALCDSAENPRYIETLPRRGYRFVAPVCENRESRAADATAAPLLLATEPVRSRRKTRSPWIAACAAGMVAIALVGLLTFRHSPVAANRGLDFHARDWALITQFENRTRESIFDGVVEAALARELTNSQFVTVVPKERVNDALALMRQSKSTAVDATIGREVCLRDGGIRALIAGRIEKVGSAYVLSAELIEPATGRAISSFEQDADGQTAVLRAVHTLANDVRQSLGQKLSEIQQSEIALQKVTTPSLKALQLYSRADQEMRDGSSQAAAFELLRQAIAEDPSFASAYILAAYALDNQHEAPAEVTTYAKRALELSGQASDSERYFIEGSYYEMTHQPDKAVSAYEALVRIDPGHFWGLNNLTKLYASKDQMQAFLEVSVRHADVEPNQFYANWWAGYNLALLTAKPGSAAPYFERANQLLSTMSDVDRAKLGYEGIWMQLFPASQAWMRDDLASMKSQLDRAEHNPVAGDISDAAAVFANFHLALGETHKARAWLMQASPPQDAPSAEGLAWISFLTGDHARARKWLDRSIALSDHFPMNMPLLTRVGMAQQASALSKTYKQWPPQWRNASLGEFLVSQGRTASGIRLLQDGTSQARLHAHPSYFLNAETLAQAYESTGNFASAVEVLESATANRIHAYGPFDMLAASFWMRDELDLAHLYRRLNRVKEAQAIENELRKLLAYADADYPILVELNRLQSSASLADRGN